MTTKRKFFGALAGLALASLSPAHAQQYSPAAPANEWVRCHAVTSVPMTADAEQALPMHITGTLPCGAEVSVLSDVEGYTVNVRTADGQTGYVARMYLTAIPAPAAPKPVTSAVVENNIARWVSGGAGSDQFVSDDSLVESLTVNGVTVQVTLHDTGWKLRANVAVANDGTDDLAINPSKFTLQESSPTVRQLPYQDAKEMAQSVSHGVLWTSVSATSPSAAKQYADPGSAINVAYKTPFIATQTPNYLVPAQTAQLDAAKHDVDLNAVHQIHNTALREGQLAPGTKAAGAVWFERDKKAEQLVLHVPVGQTIYEFPLSFSHSN
jgi:hypothetical protein